MRTNFSVVLALPWEYIYCKFGCVKINDRRTLGERIFLYKIYEKYVVNKKLAVDLPKTKFKVTNVIFQWRYS